MTAVGRTGTSVATWPGVRGDGSASGYTTRTRPLRMS